MIEVDRMVPRMFDIIGQSCTGDLLDFFVSGSLIGTANFTCSASIKTPLTGSSLQGFGGVNGPGITTFQFPLSAGTSLIKTTVIESANGGAFVASLSTASSKFCGFTASGLFVTSQALDYTLGSEICLQAGLQPADINILNFDVATQLAINCSGPFSSTYIGSYWRNKYQNSCLELYTGNTAPGGAIAVPVSCQGERHFMCQASSR
jgi:hypothetical protein